MRLVDRWLYAGSTGRRQGGRAAFSSVDGEVRVSEILSAPLRDIISAPKRPQKTFDDSPISVSRTRLPGGRSVAIRGAKVEESVSLR